MKYKSVMFFFSFKFSEVESVMGYCVIYTMLKTESFFFLMFYLEIPCHLFLFGDKGGRCLKY